MNQETYMEPVGYIRNDFKTKFGLPRQSGIIGELASVISFEPAFRSEDAFRGLEDFSHIWVIWRFDDNEGEPKRDASLTVRPPKLGGNKRVGVFASRSPFRPNPIGLSCVKLEKIVHDPKEGTLLYVTGGDFRDGTAVLDIKPYLPQADSIPDAARGFTGEIKDYRLKVKCPCALLDLLPGDKHETLLDALKEDPRPGFHKDEDRIYGFSYAGFEISFKVKGRELTVTDVKRI